MLTCSFCFKRCLPRLAHTLQPPLSDASGKPVSFVACYGCLLTATLSNSEDVVEPCSDRERATVARLEKELLTLYRGGAVLRRTLLKAVELAEQRSYHLCAVSTPTVSEYLDTMEQLRNIANADWEDLQKLEQRGVASEHPNR